MARIVKREERQFKCQHCGATVAYTAQDVSVEVDDRYPNTAVAYWVECPDCHYEWKVARIPVDSATLDRVKEQQKNGTNRLDCF